MPRLKGNTKEIILEKSLKLFSINGFEAVSIRTIAAEVGIGNSALYKHFPSKQAIFDALVEDLKSKYMDFSEFVSEDIKGVDAVTDACLRMFEYQTENEQIVNFRQLLLIEKFRNPHMAKIYREFFIEVPLNKLKTIFESLQDKNLMIKGDPFVFAMELYSPFYLYHFVEHGEDLKDKYRVHVKNFSRNFIMSGKPE